MVLCKGADARGLVFYTNIESAKGRELAGSAAGGGAFPLEIAAPPGPVPRRRRRSDARPRATPISPPGRGEARSAPGRASSRGPLASRADLEAAVEAYERRFGRATCPGRTTGAATGSTPWRSSSGATGPRGCTSGSCSRARRRTPPGKSGCFIPDRRAPGEPNMQPQANWTIKSQINEVNLLAFTCVLFLRIGTFQWVTVEENKKILPPSPALCANVSSAFFRHSPPRLAPGKARFIPATD